MSEEKFMKRALEIARQSMEVGNEPFGAVLVKNGEIVREGSNEIHTQTDPTNHAEIGLIRDFCRESGVMDLSKYTLYTSCEPCCMCSGAMVWASLGKMCYSVSHDELAQIAGSNIMIGSEEVFSRSPYQPEVVAGVLKDEGLRIVKEYKW